jgi:chromate transporter
MTAVTWQLSRGALVDLITGSIAALSAILLIYFRLNSAWLVILSGLVGLTATRLGG